jgi:mono/diheme cytochrome c family protein
MSPSPKKISVALLAFAALLLAGCRRDMQDQPRLEPFMQAPIFDNGTSNQPIPAGTVARGLLRDDTHYWYGRDDAGQLVSNLPAKFTVDRQLLERGRDRFEIYCSPCHDSAGGGRGMIVRRGFKQPEPLWQDRLRAMPIGYFYDVATNGFGIMPSYKIQVPEDDRWAIAAYIRVLQVSQGSRLDELPATVQQEFHSALSASHAAASHAAAPSSGHGAGH